MPRTTDRRSFLKSSLAAAVVAPALGPFVHASDKSGSRLPILGEDPAWRERALDGFKMRGQRDQWLPGKFVHPHDACFDRDGNIFVTEWVSTGRVSFLRKLA